MKKSVLFALCLALAGNAVRAHEVMPQASGIVQDDRTQVKPEDLPDAVKMTLTSEQYKSWEVELAYMVKTPVEYYEVRLRRESETRTVKFDRDGKAIEELK